MSFFRMSQDLNMALRFCFKQQLPPPSYHICRFSTVQKRCENCSSSYGFRDKLISRFRTGMVGGIQMAK